MNVYLIKFCLGMDAGRTVRLVTKAAYKVGEWVNLKNDSFEVLSIETEVSPGFHDTLYL